MDIQYEPCDECGKRENTVTLCPKCLADEVYEHLDVVNMRVQLAKQQAEMAKLRKQLSTPRAGGGEANHLSRGTSPAAGQIQERYAMSDVTEVKVYCARCGAGLRQKMESGIGRRRNMPQFCVMPCEDCLQDAFGRGYEQAQEES